MNLHGELDGVCHRCGASRLAISLRDRRAVLPTCGCRDETLHNMLNAILNVLEREITEPVYEQARQELKDFITEFDDEN